MQLSTKISTSVALFVVVALLISTAAFITQGYTNFKADIRNAAENTLIVFQAIHTQSMLNRGTTQDNDPVITTMDATMEQLGKTSDRLSLWMVMAPKVIAFQEMMGQQDIEPPQDNTDREAIDTGKTVDRVVQADIFRLTVPVILGQGNGAHEKCFECHSNDMGIEKGEVIGAYSIALSVKELWADFMTLVVEAVLVAILVSLLVGGISVFLLKRMASGPIIKITKAMKKLADGETQTEIPSHNSNDEIGDMAKALEVFKDNAIELNFQKFALDEHAIVSSTDGKGSITYINDKFCEIAGYSKGELLGKNHNILKSDEHSPEFYKMLWRTLTHGKVWHGNLKNRRKDGSEYWVKSTIVPFLNSSGEVFQYVSVQTDITEQKQAAQLKEMAHHDALTGLPNRNLFGDRLMLAIAQSKRLDAKMTFLYLDLDKFKPINDTLGHDVGDVVLQEVARRLTECVRETDTVARMGGDEFAIILTPPVTAEISQITAERVLKTLSEPIIANENTCIIGASIGISIYPIDTDDAETLIKFADAAMYKVKDSGRNGICFYGEEPI